MNLSFSTINTFSPGLDSNRATPVAKPTIPAPRIKTSHFWSKTVFTTLHIGRLKLLHSHNTSRCFSAQSMEHAFIIVKSSHSKANPYVNKILAEASSTLSALRIQGLDKVEANKAIGPIYKSCFMLAGGGSNGASFSKFNCPSVRMRASHYWGYYSNWCHIFQDLKLLIVI